MFFLRHSFKRTSLLEIWREHNWLKTWSENGFGGQIDHPLMLRILVAPGPSFEGGEESKKACAFLLIGLGAWCSRPQKRYAI